ncbi:MAG: PIN domain-containing protein, partial [Candidatus Geothermarchaeales archaeon]
GQHILHSDIVMERVDGQTFKEAWNLFQKLGKLSFTDCTSLVLMRKRRIRNIATYDKELLDRAKAI